MTEPTPSPFRAAWARRLVSNRLVSSRLVHFLALGGLIFALTPRPRWQPEVYLDPARIEVLKLARAHQLGKQALTAAEASDVETRAVEDEILYREALRMGIDEDDAIIRQRLIQKLLFVAEDMGGASRPLTDPELRECYARNSSRYRLPAQARLVHVYAAERETAAALRSKAESWSAQRGDSTGHGTGDSASVGKAELIPPLGEAFPHNRLVEATLPDLATRFGDGFSDAVSRLEVGAWSQPIQSRFGWHLVRVLERQPEHAAAFEEVRGELALDCLVDRREEAVSHYLDEVFPRYKVSIGGRPLERFTPTRRTAPRGAPSMED